MAEAPEQAASRAGMSSWEVLVTKDSRRLDRLEGSLEGLRPSPRTGWFAAMAAWARYWPRLPAMPAMRINIMVCVLLVVWGRLDKRFICWVC
jgi:hypothetical protein